MRLCLPSMGFAASRTVSGGFLGRREDMGERAGHGSVIGFAQNPPQLETLHASSASCRSAAHCSLLRAEQLRPRSHF